MKTTYECQNCGCVNECTKKDLKKKVHVKKGTIREVRTTKTQVVGSIRRWLLFSQELNCDFHYTWKFRCFKEISDLYLTCPICGWERAITFNDCASPCYISCEDELYYNKNFWEIISEKVSNYE